MWMVWIIIGSLVSFLIKVSLKRAYGYLIIPHPAHLNSHLENGALDGLNHHIKTEMFSSFILSFGKWVRSFQYLSHGCSSLLPFISFLIPSFLDSTLKVKSRNACRFSNALKYCLQKQYLCSLRCLCMSFGRFPWAGHHFQLRCPVLSSVHTSPACKSFLVGILALRKVFLYWYSFCHI